MQLNQSRLHVSDWFCTWTGVRPSFNNEQLWKQFLNFRDCHDRWKTHHQFRVPLVILGCSWPSLCSAAFVFVFEWVAIAKIWYGIKCQGLCQAFIKNQFNYLLLVNQRKDSSERQSQDNAATAVTCEFKNTVSRFNPLDRELMSSIQAFPLLDESLAFEHQCAKEFTIGTELSYWRES